MTRKPKSAACNLMVSYFPLSVVVPTRNSDRTLKRCLASLFKQDYPKDLIELIVIDAFSSDQTRVFAQQFGSKILDNPLLTGEAGKALGVEAATKDLILFLDSDNVLPHSGWLLQMIEPFQDESIIGAQPLYYHYSENDPLIIRYCSLIGADDPVGEIYLGFGRQDHKLIDKETYFKVTVGKEITPLMGANGFIVRASALGKTHFKPYLFDIDVVHELADLGFINFAWVKTSISHLYAFTVSQYMRKTHRRIRDLHLFYRIRRYPWSHLDMKRLLSFVLCTLLIFPVVGDAVKGYRERPDVAWFLHWLICFLVICIYFLRVAISRFCLLRTRRLPTIKP